jgi:16S rRNA (guanine966-N2)-methyltransferase
MVRITGGLLKGRSLKVYSGGEVRPTSDKVRQALFNILRHRFNADFEGVRALDLFAGSGALGLEALSRGAREVLFVEADPHTAKVLSANVKTASEALKAQRGSAGEPLRGPFEVRQLTQPVERLLKRTPERPYDLILIDPPYAMLREGELLALLREGWLSEEGYVMVEHAKRNLFEVPDGWRLDVRRGYGDTYVSLLSLDPSPDAPPHDEALEPEPSAP